ncbi:oxidoreductase [Sorangium cellulosum]|uniref:Oxidoreductase n=1 Tax=Sorangium cellulosum TaxID=56 RepID=A0A2L0EZF6_SORCE|nr:SDR family oxidoreductase [Sorangium cellulosum]AUX44691.1 oxidoreductase [Sorangium cellulosum]
MNNESTGSETLIQAGDIPAPARGVHAAPFAPRAALVTGASRGLGAALARELARNGAQVVLVARERAPLEAVAAEINAQGGVAHALAADIGDKGQTYAIAGAAAALVGPIDLLIHNASTLGRTPLPILLDTECEDLGRVLEVNVVGPFRLTKVVAGAMALRRRGVVVHISSDAAVSAYPRWGAYGVSKAALDHLSRTWAAELEGTGVSFYAVDPGEMNTRMHAEAIPEADPNTLADPADVARRIVALVARAGDLPSGARVEAARLPEAP